MIKKYRLFKENMDQAKSIMAKKMESFEKLKKLLEKNTGYLGKFTEYLMYENISYDDLVDLYNRLLSLKTKNKNIDISELKYEKVLDTIIEIENDSLILSLINKFPSEQKNLTKSLISNKVDKKFVKNTYYNIFLKIANKENIDAFISKISRYKNSNDLINASSIFSKDRDNNIESVKDRLKSLKSEIVFDDKDVLMIQISSNSDLKVLASDASWCILQPSTYSNYVKAGRKQFVMFDYSKDEFDPKFKIGFTLNTNGSIYAAHDILDKGYRDQLESRLIELGVSLESLMDVKPKTGLSSSNSLESIKDFISGASIDIVKSNIASILNKIGYGSKSKGYSLTSGRIDVMSKLVHKVFKSYTCITKVDLDEFDLRLNRYFKEHSSPSIIKSAFIDSNIFTVDGKTDDAIEKGLSLWSDVIIFNFSSNAQSIFRYNKDYSEFDQGNFTISRESIVKISDRFNKIYNSNSYDKENCSHFYKSLVMLNYALGRGGKTPDHDTLIKSVQSYVNRTYIGLIDDTVDISDGLSLGYTVFPIEKIKKKDYDDTSIYMASSAAKYVPILLKHLDGYKINICIKKPEYSHLLDRLGDDEYSKFFLATCQLLPKTFRVGQKATYKNLTIRLV